MSLHLLPAVDVKDGRAVRLVNGELSQESIYGAPLDAALDFQRAGAQWIHLVDLDAAFGRGSNADLLAEVVGRLDIDVELSGGIRDDESLSRALATGCRRVNLGTAAQSIGQRVARDVTTLNVIRTHVAQREGDWASGIVAIADVGINRDDGDTGIVGLLEDGDRLFFVVRRGHESVDVTTSD